MLAAQKAVPGAAVAVINRLVVRALTVLLFCLSTTIIMTTDSSAAILPEQRADILYHSYDGGGVTIDGPSVLVRKNMGDKFSFAGNYYIDMVTSASVDVLATASAYTEERTEYSFGMDYLNDRTIMSLSYANSTENDYVANTLSYGISQEFFGDLSTLTLGFALGDDTVTATGADAFEAGVNRKRYSLGLSQILTKRFITSFSYEAVFDEGFLRNPYRKARVYSSSEPRGFAYIEGVLQDTLCQKDMNLDAPGGECYPDTRNSEAFAIRGIYALTNQSSLRAEYRSYTDSWDLASQNIELRFTHQLSSRWLFELRARQYNQSTGAFFYQDIINVDASVRPKFYGRDKELGRYSSQQYGFSATHTFKSHYEFFNNSTLNFSWDHMTFDYDNFNDASNENLAIGEEPLYSLKADVFRVFYSAFF